MKTFRSVLITFVLLCLAAQVWAAPVAPVLSYETNGLNLSITWTQVPDATGYKLYYAPYPFPGPESIGSIDVGNLTSMHVTLPEGAAYYIAVTAYDASGAEGPISNVEQFIITLAASDAPVLSVVTDGLYVSLSWTAVPGAAGYKLYYADDTAPESFQGFDAGGLTNISFYLWEGAAFYLKVTAYTSSGLESEFSNTEYFVMGPPTPEWVDDDGDGFIEFDGDCDDTDASINPSALEVCGDGVDQDCDGMDKVCPVGANDVDDDGDGYTENQGDCNDGDATINPASPDLCEDGIDQDCNGADRICIDPNAIDNDGDGYTENQGDCNDGNSSIHPGAREVCNDGVDQDCQDGDLICVETPTFSPQPGIYNDVMSVSLIPATGGATIYYTTDGSPPSIGSNVYSTPLTVSETQTIKAIAVKTGLQNSEVVSGTYTIININGTWAIRLIMGSNTCLQPVGEETIFGNVQVSQDGTSLTITSPYGTEQGVIQGDSMTWTMTYPYQDGSMSGDLSFSTQLTVTGANSFSGPVDFTFINDSGFRCNGSGTIYGDRL